MAAGDAALEFVGGPLGDQLASVEDRYPVGELVSLLQILRRQEDRDAAGDEVADDLPHGAAASRVQAGGRLVEEDDARVPHQCHREVEPAPHSAGVGGGRLLGRVGEVEAPQQFGRAPPTFGSAQVAQVGHQDQVLFAGEKVVHRRELPRDADRATHRVGISSQVVAGDARFRRRRRDERGKNVHRGGLAGAVGTEQREDLPLRDVQIYAVEHDLLAERLAQPVRRDRRGDARHAPLLSSGAPVSLCLPSRSSLPDRRAILFSLIC